MKLTAFHAADGDCLLLSSSDGHHALIDGGRSASFRTETWPTIERLARRGERLDLVVVSHIDADHIAGILWLMKNVAAWTVFDYQRDEAGNQRVLPPKATRPPKIGKLWHNSWRAQVGELASEIETYVLRVNTDLATAAVDPSELPDPAAELVAALQDLAESIPDGIELLRTVDLETQVPRNDPFKGLVRLRRTPHVEKLGRTRLTVIGPAKKHLEALKEEWRAWLATPAGKAAIRDEAENAGIDPPGTGIWLGARTPPLADPQHARQTVASLVSAAEIIHSTDPRNVTPPNRASITLLAEEDKRSCLLTGDAAEEEILEGLEAAGRIRDGRFWCNVVKVQHHGSEHNLSQLFAGTVLADQYVFCGDGANGNPNPSVVKTLIETRLATDPRPFTIWFNSSPERVRATRKKAMREAVNEALKAQRKNAKTIKIKQLAPGRRYHTINI